MPQDITGLFRAAGIAAERPVRIETNEHSYTVKENPADNWNFHAFYAFKRLKLARDAKSRPTKIFATIGSGNGVDAIGASRIFGGLEKVMMTDIDGRVVGLCKENFSKNLGRKNQTLEFGAAEGFLCAPLIEAGVKADVIYANIPNIPENPRKVFVGRNSSGFFDRSLYGDVPEEFEKYLMVSQYAILKSAKKALAKGGDIVVNFGGRVPYGLIEKLFEKCGYGFGELCCGFKMQTETREMLEGYGKGEGQNGVEFDFYRHDESMRFLESKGIENPTSKIKGAKLKELLSSFRVSSKEGLNLFGRGAAIGHTVHLLRGMS